MVDWCQLASMADALSISVPMILTRAIAVTVINQSCYQVSGRSFCNHVTDFCHQAMYFLLGLSNFYAFDPNRNSTSALIVIEQARCAPVHFLHTRCNRFQYYACVISSRVPGDPAPAESTGFALARWDNRSATAEEARQPVG